MFLLKNIFYFKPLQLVGAELRQLQKDHRVSVIAHSFGSWLLLKALTEDRELKVHNVILCGSIVPRATSHWRQLKNDTGQITGQIVNFCGIRDPFPVLAELLSRDFGATGTTGAGDPFVEDSYHDQGHSGFLTREFCHEHWIKILQSSPRTRNPAPLSVPHYIQSLLWLAAHRGLLLIGALVILLGSYWLYRSEWSCAVRSCFVDVVRTQNYLDSRRREGVRRYVNRMIFEYSFNYDTEEYIFRAAKDRNATVVSYNGPLLTPLIARESVETIKTGDYDSQRQLHEFRIPVTTRRAYFSAEFANTQPEPPNGVSAFASVTIRNFRLQLVVPDEVSLVPLAGDFRKGILIDGQPLDTKRSRRCEVDADGKAFRCTELNLQPRQELFYCFSIKGWGNPDEVRQSQAKVCEKIITETNLGGQS